MNQTKKAKKHRLNKTRKGGFFRALFKPGSMGVKRNVDELSMDYYKLNCDSKTGDKNCDYITNRLTTNINRIKQNFINAMIEYARDGGVRNGSVQDPYGIKLRSNIQFKTVTVNNKTDYRYKPGVNWDLICVQKTLTFDQYEGVNGIRKNKNEGDDENLIYPKEDRNFNVRVGNLDRERLSPGSGNLLLVVLKNKVPIYSNQNETEPDPNIHKIDKDKLTEYLLKKRTDNFLDIIDWNKNIVNFFSIHDMLQPLASDFLFVNEISPFLNNSSSSFDMTSPFGQAILNDTSNLCNIIKPHNITVDQPLNSDFDQNEKLSDMFIKNGLSVDKFLNSIPKLSNNYPKLNEYFLSNLQCSVVDLDSSTVVIQTMSKWTIGEDQHIFAIVVQTMTGNFKTNKVDFTYNIFWLKNENIQAWINPKNGLKLQEATSTECSNFSVNFYKYVYYSFNTDLSLDEVESEKLKKLMTRDNKFVTEVDGKGIHVTNVDVDSDTTDESERDDASQGTSSETPSVVSDIQNNDVNNNLGTPDSDSESGTTNESFTDTEGESPKVSVDNTSQSNKPSVLFVTHQKRLDRIFNNYGYVDVEGNPIPYKTYVDSRLREPELRNNGKTKIGFRNCVILEVNMNEEPTITDSGKLRKVNVVYNGSATGKNKYAYISTRDGDLKPELYIKDIKDITESYKYDRLFLCRHGEGLHNTLGIASKIYQSRKVWDGGLTQQGITDAKEAGTVFSNHLSDKNITDLVVGTSYLRRTMLTFAYMYEKIASVIIVNNTMYVVPCINEIGSGLENVRSIVKVKDTSQFKEKDPIPQLAINWDYFDTTKGRWVRKDATTGNICPDPLSIAEDLMTYITNLERTGGTIRNRTTRKRAFSRRKIKSLRRTRKNKTSKRKRTSTRRRRRRRIQ